VEAISGQSWEVRSEKHVRGKVEVESRNQGESTFPFRHQTNTRDDSPLAWFAATMSVWKCPLGVRTLIDDSRQVGGCGAPCHVVLRRSCAKHVEVDSGRFWPYRVVPATGYVPGMCGLTARSCVAIDTNDLSRHRRLGDTWRCVVEMSG